MIEGLAELSKQKENLEKVAFVLKTIGHPIRLKIIILLSMYESMTVNDIVEKCDTEQSLVSHHLNNMKLNDPYNIDKPLIQTSQDPRIQAEGKAGQSTDKGIIFVSESNFESEAGSEWVIGTCVKSPCVAAGNNELVSAYR